MKKNLVFILCFYVQLSLAQVNLATYSFKIADEAPEDLQFLIDEVNPLAENNPLFLYFSLDKSYYTSYNNEQQLNLNFSDALSEAFNPLFVDLKNNNVLSYFQLDQRYVVKRENFPEWEITNESKNIGGYTCYKANGKIKKSTLSDDFFTIEAWFCPELPYAFGPKKLIGLPGLIIYAVDRNAFIFKLEKLQFNVDYNLDNILFNGETIGEKTLDLKLKEQS